MSEEADRPANTPAPIDADGGRLAENIMHFGRVLRTAGLPVGPAKVLRAIEAVRTVGIASREDFYWALHSVLVNRYDQREVFDQAFHVFWRNPQLLERMLAMLLPSIAGDNPSEGEDLSARVAEAMSKGAEEAENRPFEEEEDPAVEVDAALTFSRQEVLSEKDFEKMTNAELDQARRAIRQMRLAFRPVKTRRFRMDPGGRRVDLRATLRDSARRGGDDILLKRRSRRSRPPPVVVLCDISGSMDRYARMLLHFLHALTNDRDRVHSFLFGTRLSNITRALRRKDPDVAIDAIADQVEDWAGGTRIGDSLADFNRNWSRRVMTQGPIVLLITDGLDQGGSGGGSKGRSDAEEENGGRTLLEREVERLHLSARELIWLNPLLRWDGYAPKAAGARALIRHVDRFLPVHSLDSLHQLAQILCEDRPDIRQDMGRWKDLAA